jgi:hypothetical protein
MSTRVQLVVTGNVEEQGLHLSLRRLFTGQVVEFLPPIREQDFTSARLKAFPSAPVDARNTRARKLARTLIDSLRPPRRRDPVPDVAIAVDDLELANADQAAHVVGYFGSAVRAFVDEAYPVQSERNAIYRQIQARTSFHLFVPLLESYFFGEPAALGRASADLSKNIFNPAVRDVEDFEVVDPAYMAPPPDADWKPNPRHPKAYLKYLCHPRAYRETHE